MVTGQVIARRGVGLADTKPSFDVLVALPSQALVCNSQQRAPLQAPPVKRAFPCVAHPYRCRYPRFRLPVPRPVREGVATREAKKGDSVDGWRQGGIKVEERRRGRDRRHASVRKKSVSAMLAEVTLPARKLAQRLILHPSDTQLYHA